MVAIDVSRSTQLASGSDIDGDGELGVSIEGETGPVSSDTGDSILAAEAFGVLALLEQADPERVRVGIVAFSGEVDPFTGRQMPLGQDAWVEVPLTSDFPRVSSGLKRLLDQGPHGATNYAAAIQLATLELAPGDVTFGVASKPRADARRWILFLTDGVPTFPAGLATVSDPEDREAAVAEARFAAQAGITINSYAIGSDALVDPRAAREIASEGGGCFTAVSEPGEIVKSLEAVPVPTRR